MSFECFEVCGDLPVECQRKVNYSFQVFGRQVNLQELWLQKEEENDEFDGCLGYENDKMIYDLRMHRAIW